LLPQVAAKPRSKKEPASFNNTTFVLFLGSLAFAVLLYYLFRAAVDLYRAIRELLQRQKRKQDKENRVQQANAAEANKEMTKSQHRKLKKRGGEPKAAAIMKIDDSDIQLKIMDKKLWMRIGVLIVATIAFIQFSSYLGSQVDGTSFDPYETLGVSESTPKNAIRKTYRNLAAKWHPDKNRGNPNALAKFESIGKAAKILLNDENRKKWDEGLSVNDMIGEDDNLNSIGMPEILKDSKVEGLLVLGYASLFIVVLPLGFFHLKNIYKHDKIRSDGKANEGSVGKFINGDLRDLASGFDE
jgi:DnaJ-domain-containing protein 1